MGLGKISDEALEILKQASEKISKKINEEDYKGEIIHPEDFEERRTEKEKRPVIGISGNSGNSKRKAQLVSQLASSMFDIEMDRPFKNIPEHSSGGKIGRKKKQAKSFGKNKKKRKK